MSAPPVDAALRDRVATMVSTATDGEVTTEEILTGGGSLAALGVGSLAVLRLVDALDDELGVQLDLDTPGTHLDDFDDLVRTVQEQAVADDLGHTAQGQAVADDLVRTVQERAVADDLGGTVQERAVRDD
ncbi:hypothetical protein ACQEVZ_16260 [Dactylosporangium sp. CA-152071]|uniref:hypothetical protein n=1 Tax=Dactylosporangium sp. CA-152071 TaxID=3239933 RepID=UPI003D8EFCBE